jgi:hypothetical protein
MTIDDLKKLDRQVRLIPDPFGRGFQTLKMTLNETAEKNGASAALLADQYMAWKWRK